jgi:phosphomannomutase
MPVISRFYGIIIKMFYDDHNPPHFHAEYAEYKATIKIKDFTLTKGYLPPRALGLVMEWAALHQEELLNDWELARNNESLSKIEPLK